MADSRPEGRPPAPWASRGGAWFIDLVFIGGFVTVLGDFLRLEPTVLTLSSPLELSQYGLLLFVYWTLFETTTGQSPGKMVLALEVVDGEGRPPTLRAAALESFGKSFLLPLDVLIGVLAMQGQGLRLSNWLSGTRVVEGDTERPRNRRASAVEA